MIDLDNAIDFTRKSMESLGDDPEERIIFSNNLAIYLEERYDRTEVETDIDEAIHLSRKTLEDSLDGEDAHIMRGACMHSLATSLYNKYHTTGELVYLEEAVTLSFQAVSVTGEPHTNAAALLNYLAKLLVSRYLEINKPYDLDLGIELSRKVLEMQSRNKLSADQGQYNFQLGFALEQKYTLEEKDIYRKESIFYYQLALRQHNARTFTRIMAGASQIRLYAGTHEWTDAYEAAKETVRLISQLTPRSLQNSDKQHALGQVVGLASTAAAVALHAGKGPVAALDFLEQGRGLLAASFEEMRVDVMELQSAYPELAERLFALRKELELPPTRVALSTNQDPESVLSARATQRYEVGNDFVKLLDEIRSKEGFESFLAAPSEQDMRDAAKYGPIIIVNTSEYGCDAILIESKHIRHLALPRLEIDDIKNRVQEGNFGSSKVLTWLWDCVTEPILNSLGFTPHDEGDWPHLWWIPTGPLTRFPLHAAGYHVDKSGRTVLDRAMSSYSSSVKTMIHGRRRDKSESPRAVSDALLVAIQDTPGHVTSLPFAPKEIVAVRRLCSMMGVSLVEPGAWKQDILLHLPHCQIFHFAGHGYTDERDSSHSYLLLKDGRNNPLSVANLLEINLYGHSPFLAYLSACGTGQPKNDQFADESIHLTSACQMVGFLHVIGTLWEVNDQICVDMARITYEGIKDGGMTGNSVCRGLHNASRELRDRWLDSAAKSRRCGASIKDRNDESTRDVLLDEDDDEVETRGPPHWVSYVHFGI